MLALSSDSQFNQKCIKWILGPRVENVYINVEADLR